MVTAFLSGTVFPQRTRNLAACVRTCHVRMSSGTSASSTLVAWPELHQRVLQVGTSESVDAACLLGSKIDPHGPLRPSNTRDGCLRLFGEREEDVRVTLYRDPAYWCPYCQRVQLQLEYKRVPYRIRMINMRCYGSKPSYYLRLVPSGLLPAIELDGKLVTESQVIMITLEEAFPSHKPLLPQRGSNLEELYLKLMKMERECFSLWCGWMFRPSRGSDGPKRRFELGLKNWSDALEHLDQSGPFLMGTRPCLVDIMAIPFFERYTATAVYWKGYQIRDKYKAIDSWMKAMETQVQAYGATKADFYSTVHDIPPQYGSAFFDKGAEPYQRFIDGHDGSWELPLKALKDNVPEAVPYDETEESFYRLEAAASVIRGGEKLARFATRALVRRPRTVTAPLSDPDASVGDETAIRNVDRAFRAIVSGLIDTTNDSAPSTLPVVSNQFEEEADLVVQAQNKLDVAKSLVYFRDRIGVPRDMSFGAARQLRAHINHYNQQLLGEKQWTELREAIAVPISQ